MMSVRPALPSDAPALGEILSDWIDATPWMPRLYSRGEDTDFVADMIRAGGVDTLLTDDYPSGFLEETDGHISALYLAQEARGKGGGAMLIDAAKARHPSLDLWTFEANAGAIRFYRRHGFAEAERGADNAEGLPDMRLTWERKPS